MKTELSQVVARRLALTVNPKPSYGLDGESWSWSEYYQMLLTQQIEIEKAIQRAGGPFQVITRAVV